MRKCIVGSSLVMSLTVGPVALAGTKVDLDVTIDMSTSTASGSMGSARALGSPPKDIGCKLEVGAGQVVTCWAELPPAQAGQPSVYLTCTTPNNRFVQAVTALNASSFLKFVEDPQTGYCTSIVVQNGSRYFPMQP